MKRTKPRIPKAPKIIKNGNRIITHGAAFLHSFIKTMGPAIMPITMAMARKSIARMMSTAINRGKQMISITIDINGIRDMQSLIGPLML